MNTEIKTISTGDVLALVIPDYFEGDNYLNYSYEEESNLINKCLFVNKI